MDESNDNFSFPNELCISPSPLIAFANLDVNSSYKHSSIWKMFTENRHQDRIPFNFKLISQDHKFPVMKSKKTSYERYIPKGILKRKWMTKHLNELPSLVALFFELEWNDPNWLEKKTECTSKVHHLRSLLDGRSTKIAVVLIQRTAPLATVEDSFATDQAASLCNAGDIHPKNMFIIYTDEHLQGFILRIETAFSELVQNYYQQLIRNIKSHREQLNNIAHQYLFVRHQFKIAFFNELKRDSPTAHNHYSQAYAYVSELRITDTNLQEVRTVSAFLLYKCCQAFFTMSQPKDAISKFSTHVELMKSKRGPPELLFEYYMMLSSLYSMFGDVFCEATTKGLPAVQSRHPGFYYEQAASYAIKRKHCVQTLCKDIISYPEPDPLSDLNHVEYFGQRPWRPGKLGLEPMDASKEQNGVLALKYREKFMINHSETIISHLGKAIAHFKNYKSPRKRRHLAVQMAEEYISCLDYGKALTLLMHMLWEYRGDRWWDIIGYLIVTALQCAYLTASVQEYAELCFEGIAIFVEPGEKKRLMKDLMAIAENMQPSLPQNLDENEIIEVSNLWLSRFVPLRNNPYVINAGVLISFVRCKIVIENATGDLVTFSVYLKSFYPYSFRFSNLTATVASPPQSPTQTAPQTSIYSLIDHTASDENYFNLNPGEVRSFRCTFEPSFAAVGTEIHVSNVSMSLGTTENIVLSFTGTWNQQYVLPDENSNLISFHKEAIPYNKIVAIVKSVIKPRVSRAILVVDHRQPNLLAEWYPLKVTVKNEEKSVIENCRLNLSVSGNDALLNTEICDEIGASVETWPRIIDTGDIRANDEYTKTFYLKIHSVENRRLVVKIIYDIKNSAEECIPCEKEICEQLSTAKPFSICASFFSSVGQYFAKLYANEKTILQMAIDFTSKWPIRILSATFELSEEVSYKKEEYKSRLSDKIFYDGESGAEIIAISIDSKVTKSVKLGFFSICWKREGYDNKFSTNVDVPLPEVIVECLPLKIKTLFQTPCFVKIPLPMSLIISNNSERLIKLDIALERCDTEASMFSGCKVFSLSILPESSKSVNFNLLPLRTGLITLPQVKMKTESDLISNEELSDLIKRSIPETIFVLCTLRNPSSECCLADCSSSGTC